MLPAPLPDCQKNLIGLGLDELNIHVYMANVLD